MVVQPGIGRLARSPQIHAGPVIAQARPEASLSNDLFERTAPLYAFMREHLFRDDTNRISASLWPSGAPRAGTLVLEVGCGPGVYARRLAARHPEIRTLGVDRSEALVTRARAHAASEGLANCRFQHGDALALDWPDGSVDAVIVARLFTVVDAPRAIGEVHRVLRPGGNCFLAEPTSALGTILPFTLLRLAGCLLGTRADPHGGGSLDRMPRRLSTPAFAEAVRSHAWSDCTIFSQDGYQYAVCQKSVGGPV